MRLKKVVQCVLLRHDILCYETREIILSCTPNKEIRCFTLGLTHIISLKAHVISCDTFEITNREIFYFKKGESLNKEGNSQILVGRSEIPNRDMYKLNRDREILKIK